MSGWRGHSARMIEHIDYQHDFGDDETEGKQSIVLILKHLVHIHRESVTGRDEMICVKDNLYRTEARLSDCSREHSRRVCEFIALTG